MLDADKNLENALNSTFKYIKEKSKHVSHIRDLKLFISILFSLLAGSFSSALAAPLFFEDNFDSLDATVWATSDNGYPAPAIDVSGGVIRMGQPGASSLDFPYVHSQTSIFPSAGDFSITIGFQYTGIAGKGDGLQVLNSSNDSLLAIWQDSSNGLLIGPGGTFSFANNVAPHEVEFRFAGGNVTTLLDGVSLGSVALSSRPAKLWFGHPTLGQVISTQTSSLFPGLFKVDSNGVVVDRWWGSGVWTTFNLDFIRVQKLNAIPEPGSLSLLGIGLVVFGLARRLRRTN